MIAAGFGFRGAASVVSLRDALSRAAQGQAVHCVATAQGKPAAPLTALAQALAVPCHGVPVAGVSTPSQSDTVAARYGCGSVAEAAALVAAGPGARLLGRRVVSGDGMATCALAEGGGVLAQVDGDTAQAGRAATGCTDSFQGKERRP